MKPRRGTRFYFVETYDEYISGLTDIMKYVQGKNDLKLILRLHPGFDVTDEELWILLPKTDNCIISRSGSFESVLAFSDLLISYSSTCIDEALLNKVPVLLYDKWNRYNHFKTNIFEGNDSKDIFPVCYCNNSENLNNAISYMINKCRLTKKEEIDVKRYKYSHDYSENFYRFIKGAL
jgi:CDP-glycerol glycerophosphotransferase (TagB/SpsB family)